MSLEKLDNNKDGRIDFRMCGCVASDLVTHPHAAYPPPQTGEFQAMNSMYPQVIFPAFRMQSNMMMYTLGTSFWLNKRNKLESVRTVCTTAHRSVRDP